MELQCNWAALSVLGLLLWFRLGSTGLLDYWSRPELFFRTDTFDFTTLTAPHINHAFTPFLPTDYRT